MWRPATKCNHQHIAYNSLQEPALPKVPGPAARDWMAARAEDSAARGVFPCRLHPACGDCPHRLLEQAGRLWPAVQSVGRDGDDHRRRPKRLGARVGMTSVLHTGGRH